MEDTTTLAERARAWMAADPDPDTRAELDALLADPSEAAAADLADRFDGRLVFGTAGLRGRLGAGPNRMNRLVVRQAAGGLLRFLQQQLGVSSPTVVIGYDARHKSDALALDTAGVVVAGGGEAILLDGPIPTPVLAFAVRHVGADAGVMVTASHNPPADNGYKVYLGDGAQIVPPTDLQIEAAIAEVAAAGPVPIADSGYEHVGGEIVDRYVAAALEAVPGTRRADRDLRLVYTPLHGVGRRAVLELLGRAGFGDIHVVPAQADPDPDFPTVRFPNPEEPGALDLALAEAERVGADLILANDPDADRLAACVPDPLDGGRLRPLTGNEVGALLADHILARTADLGPKRQVATTIVSSRLLAKQASAAGVGYVETLTGFKWIMRAGLDHPELRLVFGYEEALGYSVADVARDKDGLTAALAFAELAADARDEGHSVMDRLEAIARHHGLHATAGFSIAEFGLVDRVLAAPPTSLADRAVTEVVDLARPVGPLPPTEGVVLLLDGRARVVVRPSGTEPKTKVYLEVVLPVPDTPDGYGEARTAAAAELDALSVALQRVVRRE